MQNFKESIVAFLRDLDWHLAVLWDKAAGFCRADYARTRQELADLRALLQRTAILMPRPSLRSFAEARALAVLMILLGMCWVAVGSSGDSGDQPVYAAIESNLQTVMSSLSPISVADAALPKDADTPILTENDDDAPAEQSLADDAKPVSKTVKLGRSGSLIGALTGAGIGKKEAHNIANAVKRIYNPGKLDRDEDITVEFDDTQKDGVSAKTVSFNPSHDKRLIVTKTADNKYKAKFDERKVDVRINFISTTISGSLSQSAKKAGIPRAVLSEMTKVFSYDVDFQRDIHPGDKMEVAFEELWDDSGQFAKYGHFVYAALKSGQKDVKIFRYKPSDDSRADYFDDSGRSVRKALLRTPVDGARITAGFGMRRHPILGYSKMHEGVDFGAPLGTPVIAAGDGVVRQKGWNGGYGHYVEIQHNKEFSTAYGHLSRYVSTLRTGQRVHQGDVIGYVGSTGLSTGPHLHYEVHRGVRKVNPVGIKFSTGRQLAGKEMQKFKVAISDLQQKIASAKNGKQVARLAVF